MENNKWEEQFYQKFNYIQAIKNEQSGNSYTRIVDFITNLLSQQSTKLEEKIEGLKKEAGLYITAKSGGDCINYNREDDDNKRETYNSAIQDVLNLIKNK